MMFFPYRVPPEAIQAATKKLWDDRGMLPEHSEDIARDAIEAALPWLNFSPLGDNHHNAVACPYCSTLKGAMR